MIHNSCNYSSVLGFPQFFISTSVHLFLPSVNYFCTSKTLVCTFSPCNTRNPGRIHVIHKGCVERNMQLHSAYTRVLATKCSRITARRIGYSSPEYQQAIGWNFFKTYAAQMRGGGGGWAGTRRDSIAIGGSNRKLWYQLWYPRRNKMPRRHVLTPAQWNLLDHCRKQVFGLLCFPCS